MKLCEGLSLPTNVVTQKIAWIGTSGGGKTYGAMRLAESLYDRGAQFVVLDPVGVWYGLRLDKKGKQPSDISIPIFGGLHGDIPLESTAGKFIADLVVDKNLTVVLDVSQFESDAQKSRFAADFADRFFFRKKAAPSAVHVFLEECQEFVPQNIQRGEERMLHAFVRLQKIGRNFGIGTSLITQRPQEVSKKALNLAGTLFAFRTTGSHERKAIEQWMQDNSVEEKDMIRELPSLETGAPHLWSPEWLKVSRVVNILPKRTFDASATPEVGAKAVARNLGEIDLEKLRTEMAATIEKAKAEDPRELHKEIQRLRGEIARGAKPVIKELLKPDPKAIERAIASRDKEWSAALRSVVPPLYTVSDGVSPASGPQSTTESPARHKVERAESRASLPSDTPQGELTGPEQRIIDGMAEAGVLLGGNSSIELPLIAAAARYSVKSSSFVKALGALRQKGLIQNNMLTADGALLAKDIDPVFDKASIRTRVLGILTGPEERIMRALFQANASLSDEDLAQRAEYSPQSSSYVKARGALKSKGLLTSEMGLYSMAWFLEL